VEDIETTFVLQEKSEDLQDVAVQCTVIYRCVDPERLAKRVNFTIDLARGQWIEQPLARLNGLLSQKARPPARAHLSRVPIQDAIRKGAEQITEAIETSLRGDQEMSDLGLSCVSVQVTQISPSAELEKALQTPTREAIQQKADEASFQRRAMAVEKERAIKENELETEIELAKRQELLIRQQGANQLRSAEQDAAAEKARVTAEAERRQVTAESEAGEVRVKALAQADGSRALAEAENQGQREKVAIWTEAPTRVHLGLAMQELARNLPNIEHLNLTPDLVGDAVQKLLRDLASGD
jgi:regulator of protease activity HflC (stomatin/prohibitin superfamily)